MESERSRDRTVLDAEFGQFSPQSRRAAEEDANVRRLGVFLTEPVKSRTPRGTADADQDVMILSDDPGDQFAATRLEIRIRAQVEQLGLHRALPLHKPGTREPHRDVYVPLFVGVLDFLEQVNEPCLCCDLLSDNPVEVVVPSIRFTSLYRLLENGSERGSADTRGDKYDDIEVLIFSSSCRE